MVDELKYTWDNMISSIVMELPNVMKAILLLLLAWVIAIIARNVFNKLLVKVGFGRALSKTPFVADEKSGNELLENIGKLVYFLVFILFLPTVFGVLNMTEVAAPISNMMDKFLYFIPNIIAAAVIILIGVFVAKLVKQLFEQFFTTLNIDKWVNKVLPNKGETEEAQATLSSVISNIIFIVILIPFITIGLEALNIQTISRPIESVLNNVLAMIPGIFVAIILIVVGFYIGKFVGSLLTNLLRGANINKVFDSLGISNKVDGKGFDIANFVGKLVQIVIVLFFTVEAFQVINLKVLNTIGFAIITYLPFLLSAIVILGVGLLLANIVGNWVQKNTNNAISALLIKGVIITFAVFMTLDQLHFATSIVNIAFMIILGGFMIAFAISFGIGGRDFAKRQLEKLDQKMNDPK